MGMPSTSPGAAESAPGNSQHSAPLAPVLPGGSPIALPKKCKCGVCPLCIKRAKWRDKYHNAKNKLTGNSPAPVFSTVESPANPVVATNETLPPVAHNPDDWRPVCETLVAVGEKFSIESLASKAERLKDAELVKTIRAEAPWNVAAKETIVRTAPPLMAKAAEKIGLPVEAANIGLLAGAVGQIVLHHVSVSEKIEKAIERIEAAQKKVLEASK